MAGQLGKTQFGETQIGDIEAEEGVDYAASFDELQEDSGPAGPDSPADRMYSHIKPAFRPRSNDKWTALVETFAEEFEQLSEARKEVVVSRYVELAFGQQLDRIGKFVQTPRHNGENDDHYRARLIVNFKQINAGGTIDDIKELSTVLLECSPEDIVVEEPFSIEPARIDLKVPSNIIRASGFTTDQYASYIREIKAAGVKLNGVELGGFTHRSEEDFKNGINRVSLAYNEAPYAGLF